MRNALGQRPIDLLGIAPPERSAQGRRGRHGARDDENARRIPVQPMDKARPLAFSKREVLKQRIHMLRDAAAALSREPARLVENQHARILMDHKLFG